jgi:hypothetical protein
MFVGVLGALLGFGLGCAVTTAGRTYRDARTTTRAARTLWRQVPRDWARVGVWIGWLAIVGFVAMAYWLGSR